MKIISKLSDGIAWKLLLGWVLVLTVLYSTLSVVRHNHFQSGGFDLGLYDQAIWQYSRFIPPYNTVKERFILGDHLTLTLPLLAPLFWMSNDVRILLIFQALWVSISALAIYKLVRVRKFPPVIALGLSFVYSLFFGIQYGIFFDFHPVLLATGLIPWLLYFLETKHTKLFITSLILLIFTQENMGLALTSLGFIYVWKQPYRRLSLAFIFGGITVSLLAGKIISFMSPAGFQYTPTLTLNPILFVKELFDAPEKRQVWLFSLSAFSFLPLLSPGAILAVIFDLAQYFTTGPEFARMWSPFMHHRAILAPYLLLGALEALTSFRNKRYNIYLITIVLVLSALTQQYIFHYPLNKLTKVDFWKTESWELDNKRLLATIPDDAGVATQQSLVPQLSHRKEIYIAWPRLHDFPEAPCGRKTCWWFDYGGHPKYLLIDAHPTVWLTMLLETPQHVLEALGSMEKMNKITLIRRINDVRLYQINY